MHHPVGLGALAGAAAVVDEGLLEANALTGASACGRGGGGGGVYGLVDAGGLPKTRAGDAVGPDAVPVLPPAQAKEIPLVLPRSLLQMARFWKIPRVMLVDVDLLDDINTESLLLHLPC